MKIAITKKQNRNRIVCTRDDGSYTASDLGPRLPHHDFAHYIVETTLGLKEGFYGNLARGYSFEQLGDKHVIKTLGAETWRAEILAGALGSLASGACTLDQFPALIKDAAAAFNHTTQTPAASQSAQMLSDLRLLLDRWSALRDGETLELSF